MPIDLHDGLLQVFDVDHGQCALLILPGPSRRHYVLIDCGHAVDFGGAPWYPGQHLQNIGVGYVDLLICTNYDEDHASGFPDLLQRGISIGVIFGNPTISPTVIADLKSNDGMGPGIRALATALEIRKTMGWLQVLQNIPGLELSWACNRYPVFDDENNLSVVVNLCILGWNFMFCGDMELSGWNNLLSQWLPSRELVARVHFLMAAHHGPRNGICPDMFDRFGCRPRIVVISDDYKQYNTQETTNYYRSKTTGIPWFRDQGESRVLTTRSDGEIKFTFRSGDVRVW